MERSRHIVIALVLSLASTSFADDTKPPPIEPAAKRHKSYGMIAGGIGLLIAGVGTAYGAGFATYFATTNLGCAVSGCGTPPYEWLGLAIPLAILAASGITGGIVMIAVGAHDHSPPTVTLAPSGLVVRW